MTLFHTLLTQILPPTGEKSTLPIVFGLIGLAVVLLIVVQVLKRRKR